MIARTIDTTTHGRYVVVPAAGGPAPLLVGFHGYAELAEAQLERLRLIPGADRWTIVSIQGLNRFYQRRTNEVIAGWMTRQDRELAIADNIAYIGRVVDAISREWRLSDAIVFAGFSQGVAMAFRAAAAHPAGERRPAVTGVIAAGGDVPPEIERDALRRFDAVLVCRGMRDQWYTPEAYQADLQRLREAGVPVRPLEFDGGHEWSPDVIQAAAQLLNDCRR